MWFLILSIYLLFEIKDLSNLLNFHNPLLPTEPSFFKWEKNWWTVMGERCKSICFLDNILKCIWNEKIIWSSLNEIRNLILMKCVTFFGGRFVFSKYHIYLGYHLFRLILLETSFLELDFHHLFQVYNRILDCNYS